MSLDSHAVDILQEMSQIIDSWITTFEFEKFEKFEKRLVSFPAPVAMLHASCDKS